MSAGGDRLPAGMVLAWYGDDFTGSSAVMEVLTAAGLPAVLFLEAPTLARIARFANYRAIGIAGTARSRTPQWMDEHLPAIFRALAGFGAPLIHYKVCSTFDSSPTVGSIGRAIDIGATIIDSDFIPLLIGAPAMQRYQAFGNLFAVADGVGYRLDRHPTMSRHPATPMDEADVRRHLAKQTGRAIGLIDFVAMKAARDASELAGMRAAGTEIIAIDVVDDDTLRACGRLVWEDRTGTRLVAGSQGVEYALVAHWRAEGLIGEPAAPPMAAIADRIAVVSGSCSPETARQIRWAARKGFEPIRVDVARAADPAAWRGEIDRAAAAALGALGQGHDPIIFTALGPDDAAVAAFNDAVAATGQERDRVNERLGRGLGEILDLVLRTAGLNRCVIAGGDTSGHGALALGLYALTAIAFTAPGASLCKAHSDDAAHADLEVALKGGQMGTPEYFWSIKQGRAAA